MIVRTWRGWTTPENADAYEALLKSEIFKGIAAKSTSGYRKMELLRRNAGDEVEFMTVMRFDSIDDVKHLTGDDHERAYVPASARQVLERCDERSQHFERRESIDYSTRAT